MRLFQNAGLYRAYVPRLRTLTAASTSFTEQLKVFLDDRYGACHHLQPVLSQDRDAFFTNADDLNLQRAWAMGEGLPAAATPDDVLLAQIEAHRTEVFYNMDPVRFQSEFLRRLPGCVRHTIAWRAAPSPELDLIGYDRVVCNFPSLLASHAAAGWRPAFFSPAHDPEMDAYARNVERTIDILFVGGYSRHHQRRARVLEAVAGLSPKRSVVLCLDRSRLTRMSETGWGPYLGLGKHARPTAIRSVSMAPVFGRQLYAMLSNARIVLNGAVDMAGEDRGNMRCFEAMGCGALMISDQGRYPTGMVDGESMRLYTDAGSAVGSIEAALADPEGSASLARRGFQVVRDTYDKASQWNSFVRLVADIGAR